MLKADRVTDATFEVINPGSRAHQRGELPITDPRWYPGRKELPRWFKRTMLTLAFVILVLSRIWAWQDLKHPADAADTHVTAQAAPIGPAGPLAPR